MSEQADTYFPLQVAKRFGVDHIKVLRWINSGELHAINVATRPTGQVRWRISAEALADFERRRANVPPVAPITRRRKAEAAEKTWY